VGALVGASVSWEGLWVGDAVGESTEPAPLALVLDDFLALA